jgi:hypothetical protein
MDIPQVSAAGRPPVRGEVAAATAAMIWLNSQSVHSDCELARVRGGTGRALSLPPFAGDFQYWVRHRDPVMDSSLKHS